MAVAISRREKFIVLCDAVRGDLAERGKCRIT
jgi:hypothetical protein